MPAFRNIRLCGKDCMCLYVCPTGATDTENSIIDTKKCISCMACVAACPSGAISMVPDRYPRPQQKKPAVAAAQQALGLSKVRQEKIVAGMDGAVPGHFADALAKSNLRMAEDVLRESGYLLPQSTAVRSLLEAMIDSKAPDFPNEAAELLLEKLQNQRN